MRTTFMANSNNVDRKWYVIDAEGQTLGRLASEIASILRGKHKPTFTPHVDTGDHVIILNASKIELTGKKLTDKIYYRHSMHPGGLKQRTALEMRTKYPEQMLELAIKGMLQRILLVVKCLENYTYMLVANIRTKLNNQKFTNFVDN